MATRRTAVVALTLMISALAGCERSATRPTADRSGEIPDEAVLGLVEGRPGPLWIFESPLKRPSVPYELACDWSSSPPYVRFVDPATPPEKRMRRTTQFDPAVLGRGTLLGRPIPDEHLPYIVEPDVGRASRALTYRDGQLHEVPLASLPANTAHEMWISRLCPREGELAIKASWIVRSDHPIVLEAPPPNTTVLLRREGARWIVIVAKDD